MDRVDLIQSSGFSCISKGVVAPIYSHCELLNNFVPPNPVQASAVFLCHTYHEVVCLAGLKS